MLSRFAIPLIAILKYIDCLTTTPAAHFPFRGVFPSANFFEQNDSHRSESGRPSLGSALQRKQEVTRFFLLTNSDFQLANYLRLELLQLLIAKTPAGIARAENPLGKVG